MIFLCAETISDRSESEDRTRAAPMHASILGAVAGTASLVRAAGFLLVAAPQWRRDLCRFLRNPSARLGRAGQDGARSRLTREIAACLDFGCLRR